VCTAWIERSLERVILSRLRRLTKTQHAELFVGLAPLSTLSAKIKIAFALRIIGAAGVADLEIIKDIRNQFAHSFHPVSFGTRAVARACHKLKIPELTFAHGIPAIDKRQIRINPKAARDPR